MKGHDTCDNCGITILWGEKHDECDPLLSRYYIYAKKLRLHLSEVKKENKELKEGLRFYANKERYRFYDLQRGSVETVELDNDKGQIARNLLNKIKDEDKE